MGYNNMIDYVLLFWITSGFWLGYAGWWIISAWYINVRYSQPLHRIITFFLVFKTLNSLFSLISLCLCVDQTTCYWDLAVNSTYTIYNTFLFTQLLLISVGFNIVKEFLGRGELTFVAMGMGAIYLGYSCYSIKKANFILVLILIILASLYCFIKFTLANIKKLFRKRSIFISQGNIAMSQITSEKISLFRNFLKFTILLLSGKTLYLCLKYLQVKETLKTNFGIFTLADNISETLMASGITFLVRAKFRGYLFNMYTEQLDREMQPITHFLMARVPKGFNVEPAPNLAFLVMTPKGKLELSHRNLLIANPYK